MELGDARLVAQVGPVVHDNAAVLQRVDQVADGRLACKDTIPRGRVVVISRGGRRPLSQRAWCEIA
jgi:hypothetical protein